MSPDSLAFPVDDWSISKVIPSDLEPHDSITVHLRFRDVDELQLRQFYASVTALQRLISIVIAEAEELIPSPRTTRPVVTLTYLHYGSEPEVKLEIKNVAIQRYALKVKLLIAAFAMVTGIAVKSATPIVVHYEDNAVKYEQIRSADAAERNRHEEEMARLQNERLRLEQQATRQLTPLIQKATGGAAKGHNARRVAKKLAPSCVTLAGEPKREGIERPAVVQATVAGIRVTPTDPNQPPASEP